MRLRRGSILVALLLVVGSCGGEGTAETDERASDPATVPPALAQPPPPFSFEAMSLGQQQAFSFVSGSGVEIELLLYVPEGYEDGRAQPVILFLHGFLERDPTLESLRVTNPLAWLDPGVEFPFVLVAPMGPRGQWSDYHQPLDEFLSVLGGVLSIDQHARFLTGFSAGAVGTWQWALADPDSFTGIAPIAGGPTTAMSDPVPDGMCRLVDLPIWVAHSEADPLPIDLHRATVAQLEECGSTEVEFTVYEDLGHFESIATAYAGPDLYQWMLGQIP